MRDSLSDLGLKYARAFVYIFGVVALSTSPYRDQLYSLGHLSTAMMVTAIYIALAVWCEVKEIPRASKRANITLYVLDTLMVCWIISLTGGGNSPVYPFLFLPVIFISFDKGLKDGLLFGIFAIIVGTGASLSAYDIGMHHILVSAFIIFLIALTVGFLKDNWERSIEKEKVVSSLRELLLKGLTPKQTLVKALKILGEATGADAIVYLRYDEESGRLKFQREGYGLKPEEEERLVKREIALSEGGVSVEVFQSGEPLLVQDALSHPYILKDIVENFAVGSVISFPINIIGKRWGVFHFVRRKGSTPFNEKDLLKAKDLIGEAVEVLEVVEQGKEVERRRDLLELLTKLISNLSRAINIEEVGREIFYALREVVPNLNDLALVKCRRGEYSMVFYQSEVVARYPLLRDTFEKVRETGQMVSLQDEAKNEGVIAAPVYEGGEVTHIISLFLSPFSPLSEEGKMLLSAASAEVSGILARVYSVSELERYAFHDHLTGLLNRRMFYQRMGREIKGARRYGYPISLAIMDIDNFKEYNDTYGHLEGDRALAELGKLLKEEVRASDFAARLGGEEFAIVLPHTAKESARIMADRLIRRIKEKLSLSVSIGIGEFPADADTLRSLMRQVDKALYEAKKLGKGKTEVVSGDKTEKRR